jgi:hypothetical protein
MKPLEIAVRVGGKLHLGAYTVGDEIVTVSYKGKSMATQVGGSPAETIAAMLLKELVREGRHRG